MQMAIITRSGQRFPLIHKFSSSLLSRRRALLCQYTLLSTSMLLPLASLPQLLSSPYGKAGLPPALLDDDRKGRALTLLLPISPIAAPHSLDFVQAAPYNAAIHRGRALVVRNTWRLCKKA